MMTSAVTRDGVRGLWRTWLLAAAVAVLAALATGSTVLVAISFCTPIAWRLRHRLGPTLRRYQRFRRQRTRICALCEHDVPLVELRHLRTTVEATIAADALDRDVWSVEPLLDDYVKLAVARATIHRELARSARACLANRLAALPPHRIRTRHVLEHRVAAESALARRALALDASIAQLAALVHLYAARQSEPPPIFTHDPLPSALETFDTTEAAELLVPRT